MSRCHCCHHREHRWKRIGWWPSQAWRCRCCGLVAVRIGSVKYQLCRRIGAPDHDDDGALAKLSLYSTISVLHFQRDVADELCWHDRVYRTTLARCRPEGTE